MSKSRAIVRDSDTPDAERKARKRVRELKDFYSHITTFVLVNLMLLTINVLTSPGSFWAIYPLLGWGIGLGAHAYSVFGFFGVGTRAWEERKVREYMLRNERGMTPDQVRQLLREEFSSETPSLPTQAEWERMKQRLEHLEAIVTTEEWDLMTGTTRQQDTPLLDAEPNDEMDDKARTERSTQRRVR